MSEQAITPVYQRRSLKRFIDENRELVTIFGLLLIIIAIGAFTSPNFRTERNTVNVLRQAVALGMVAMGQTFVILSGGIDLSVGSAISLTAVYTAVLMKSRPDLVLPIVLAMLFMGL